MKISRSQARSFQVNHRLVAGNLGRKMSVEQVVAHLGCVQIDPMVVVEKNHELVMHARLPGYIRGQLEQALYKKRTLVEAMAVIRCIIPSGELPYFRPFFRQTAARAHDRVGDLYPLMNEIKARLMESGPLASTDLPHTDRVSGWWDQDGTKGTRAARQALEWLWHFGEVVVAHRRGPVRYFDLTKRVFPDLDDSICEVEGRDFLSQKYFRAAGLFQPTDSHFGFCRYGRGKKRDLLARAVRSGEVVEVAIEGVPRTYYLHRDLVPILEDQDPNSDGPCRILPPLDNLIWDRVLISDLFLFDYSWEAYVPRSRRQYGPYTMPVVVGNRIVARIDARADRNLGVLVINGIWWEPGSEGNTDLSDLVMGAVQRLAVFVHGDKNAGIATKDDRS